MTSGREMRPAVIRRPRHRQQPLSSQLPGICYHIPVCSERTSQEPLSLFSHTQTVSSISTQTMAPIVLGYWDIRGYAQPIRLLLAAAGADFVEELHKVGPAPEFSKAEWHALKVTLPFDFPNLPYLYDGDVTITQSVAIQRYLARKFGLDGKTEQEKIRIDLVEQQLIDYRSQGVFYSPDYEKLIGGYKNELPAKLSALSKFLGTHQFFSGGDLSHADFLAYEWLDVQRQLVPGILSEFPNLQIFEERIEKLPGVKKFMQSDRFIKFPLNNDQAKWGSRSNPL